MTTPSVSTPKDQAREDERVEKALTISPEMEGAALDAFYGSQDWRVPKRTKQYEKMARREMRRALLAALANAPQAASARPSNANPVRAALEEAVAFLEMDDEASTPGTDLYTWMKAVGEPTIRSFPSDPSQKPLGYYFHNPDSGWEVSDSHPITSGECEDATEIEELTPARLKELLFEAWDDAEELRAERDDAALSVSTPTGEGEGLREALARHFDDSAFQTAHQEGQYWSLRRADAYRRAEALLKGPLAALAHPQQGGEREASRPVVKKTKHPPEAYAMDVMGWDAMTHYHRPVAEELAAPTSPSKSEDGPDLSYSGAPMPTDGIEGCVYCGQPFKEGDLVLSEVEGGEGHVTCMGPERDSYVSADGEPLKDGEPIPTGRSWTPTSPSKSSGEEA